MKKQMLVWMTCAAMAVSMIGCGDESSTNLVEQIEIEEESESEDDLEAVSLEESENELSEDTEYNIYAAAETENSKTVASETASKETTEAANNISNNTAETENISDKATTATLTETAAETMASSETTASTESKTTETTVTLSDGTVFDAVYYADNNSDVKALYGYDTDALLNHYLTYGKSEGRAANAEEAASQAASASTTATTTTTAATASASDLVTQVYNLVNENRSANGVASLTLDSTLCAAAQTRADELAAYGSTTINGEAHVRPDGNSWGYVLFEYGINYGTKGENTAEGYSTAQSVMDGWMNSEGHKANILNSSFDIIGIGVAQTASGKYIWVQIFANSGTVYESTGEATGTEYANNDGTAYIYENSTAYSADDAASVAADIEASGGQTAAEQAQETGNVVIVHNDYETDAEGCTYKTIEVGYDRETGLSYAVRQCTVHGETYTMYW
ncbi:MAG: CAP domain-containing protein [Lachnospiraceae bacterium]|nr:CAP domain-containing protein [Lachnospiraceae bacterium]